MATITVDLPEPLYRKIEQRANQRDISVENELLTVVAQALPDQGSLEPELENELTQLAFLTDDELWRAAHKTLSTEDSARMQELISRLQSGGLSTEQKIEAEMLAERHDRSMLIRSQSALLLRQRGFDISELGPDTSVQ